VGVSIFSLGFLCNRLGVGFLENLGRVLVAWFL
jgi:hypothetical protein